MAPGGRTSLAMAGPVRLRRPEHTGEHRCWPCTVLNLVVLGLGVVVLAGRWPAVAVGLAIVGVGAVWARGYLVPYTPRFAPRVVGWLPVDVFGHAEASDSLRSLDDGAEEPGERLLEGLLDAGVIETHGEELSLEASFRERWDELADDLAALALDDLARETAAASSAADGAEGVERGDESFVVLSSTDGGAAWVRRPVAIAETAAARALEEWGHPAANRDLAAHALGAFLETCPACGDDVIEQTAAECCGGIAPSPTVETPPVLACPSCAVRFVTLDAA